MPVSALPATLNRFPGLQLKAWGHVVNGVLRKGFNVASVTGGAGATNTVTFTTAMSAAGYIVDLSSRGKDMLQASTGAAGTMSVSAADVAAGASLPSIGEYFFAVYE